MKRSLTVDWQHLKPPGPGHWSATELAAQSLDQRQLPAEAVLHFGLVQHLMSSASAGQAPVIVVPPEAEQLVVEMQTPVWEAGVRYWGRESTVRNGRQTCCTPGPIAGFVYCCIHDNGCEEDGEKDPCLHYDSFLCDCSLLGAR